MSLFALDRYRRCLSRLKPLYYLNKPFVSLDFSSSASSERNGDCQTGLPPIRVGLTESAGRAVFATRRIGAGVLIHTAKPVVACPSLLSLDSVCYLCLKKLMGSAKIHYRERKGALSADCLDILQPVALTSTMISKVGFVSMPFVLIWLDSCGEDLLSLAAAPVEREDAVGHAVYMLPSFYSHNCDPNAHILWFHNADVRLTTLRDVEEGEELRIRYIDASMGYEARQTLLAQGFGFPCNCLRCRLINFSCVN